MKIEWKKVIIGVILSIILVFGIGLATFGSVFGFLGFVIAIMYVGYSVGGDLKNGAVHGALIGLILVVMAESFVVLVNSFWGVFNLTVNYLLFGGVMICIFGAGCGLLGSLIRLLRSSEEDTQINS
jgi:hypothetical protein